MVKLEPKPGELESPECAAFFLSLRTIYAEQDRQGQAMARDFYAMDYVSIRRWSEKYAELREQEKRIRASIFGFRRRYASPDPRRNAAPVLAAAIEASSSENVPAAGAGAPEPPTSAASKPGRRSLRVVRSS